MESYGKYLMRVLIGCSHNFRQSKIPVLLSSSIKCFKAVMVRWADLKRGVAVGKSIRRGSAYDMVLNPTLDVLSAITCGIWNFRGENHILLYLNF